MTRSVRPPVSGWFYVLAAILFLVGLGGTAIVIAVHEAFGMDRALRDQPVRTVFTSAAPVIVMGGWALLAVRQARHGRRRLAVGQLAVAFTLVAVTLAWLVMPS